MGSKPFWIQFSSISVIFGAGPLRQGCGSGTRTGYGSYWIRMFSNPPKAGWSESRQGLLAGSESWQALILDLDPVKSPYPVLKPRPYVKTSFRIFAKKSGRHKLYLFDFANNLNDYCIYIDSNIIFPNGYYSKQKEIELKIASSITHHYENKSASIKCGKLLNTKNSVKIKIIKPCDCWIFFDTLWA